MLVMSFVMKQKKSAQNILKKSTKFVILCPLHAAAASSRRIRLGIRAYQPRAPRMTGRTNPPRAPRHATPAVAAAAPRRDKSTAPQPITARLRGWALRPVGSATNRVTTRGVRLGGIRVWSPAPHLRGPTHHRPIMSRTLRLAQLRDPLCRHPPVRHALWPQKIPPRHPRLTHPTGRLRDLQLIQALDLLCLPLRHLGPDFKGE